MVFPRCSIITRYLSDYIGFQYLYLNFGVFVIRALREFLIIKAARWVKFGVFFFTRVKRNVNK